MSELETPSSYNLIQYLKSKAVDQDNALASGLSLISVRPWAKNPL